MLKICKENKQSILEKVKNGHLKDSFFSLVNDSKLMVNKEGNNYRPHFFFFEDTKTKGIYWAVPQSTKIAKYQAIIQ